MTRGMLLGKFLPPHRGHEYLIRFASGFVDQLTVVVCSLASESIPGGLRHGWVREMVPGVDVVHLTDELPQEPSEHPDFWRLWREALDRVLPGRPDFVFASEDYGERLAAELGGVFVPVDRGRTAMPVSGSAIREKPMEHWEFIPECVRPYFVRRVSVFGPESTGKSTLAKALAARFSTCHVPEYAREFLEARGGRVAAGDMETIARGQGASEDALARTANKVLVCDTDAALTRVWSEELFSSCSDWILAEEKRRRYDLTLLTDVDVAWVPDTVRYRPADRGRFFEQCRGRLEELGRSYIVIRGSWDERTDAAEKAIDELLKRGQK